MKDCVARSTRPRVDSCVRPDRAAAEPSATRPSRKNQKNLSKPWPGNARRVAVVAVAAGNETFHQEPRAHDTTPSVRCPSRSLSVLPRCTDSSAVSPSTVASATSLCQPYATMAVAVASERPSHTSKPSAASASLNKPVHGQNSAPARFSCCDTAARKHPHYP